MLPRSGPRFRASKRRGVVAAVVTFAAALALAACSSRAPVDQTTAESGELAEPIVITDQRGKTHTFTKPIEKIVTTVIPAPSMITALDQSYDRIKGVNQSTIARDKGSTFADMFPQALDNAVVSGPDFVPNVETIIQIDPDVVIQWAHQGDYNTFIGPIEAAGYPVIGLQYGTQEDLETWVRMFAKLLGKEERGQQLLDRMHKTIDELKAFAAQQTTAPRTIFLRSAGDGGYNAGMSSKDAYMNFWLTLPGAENVGADLEYSTTSAVNVEQLIQWNPEVIFTSAMTKLTPADIYADPALAGIDAVKNKRVYAVPSGGFWWDPPSAESHLMWKWAAALLHPDTYEVDLRSEIREHYEFLYGRTITDEQIDNLLRFDANAEAAGYGVFRR
ncbi:iron complex transport system substrate-binding protein [Pseudonocardia thermophila]|jgi:ABC-type Fe3+-hydroxamate transport system, periplasmic component|uniref:Iron complex transport system substrate-binding protein n=1 Tax=Pseudonocardia thermophila TaxID=1848 RepID=A0A1M6PG14_PSETH|nr:ABC transporter substrate-binding protein [Pseudonocardia thermophila]SHK06854.1 iron complex transport system substrate-binding protein [Pseudonocardia thermophila]